MAEPRREFAVEGIDGEIVTGVEIKSAAGRVEIWASRPGLIALSFPGGHRVEMPREDARRLALSIISAYHDGPAL